jgi:hypothetical protein
LITIILVLGVTISIQSGVFHSCPGEAGASVEGSPFRVRNDDLVPFLDHGQHGHEDRLFGRGDEDVPFLAGNAIVIMQFVRHGLP